MHIGLRASSMLCQLESLSSQTLTFMDLNATWHYWATERVHWTSKIWLRNWPYRPNCISIGVSHHPSATNVPRHVDDFIEKELALVALLGSCDLSPLLPWCHFSREEGESEKHRVITDLTYPSDRSINACIVKNSVYRFE